MNGIHIPNVVIFKATRLTNSKNGNPMWRLFTNKGNYNTQADASLGYSIRNLEWSEWLARPGRIGFEDRVIGNPDNPTVTLIATRANRVFGIKIGERFV